MFVQIIVQKLLICAGQCALGHVLVEDVENILIQTAHVGQRGVIVDASRLEIVMALVRVVVVEKKRKRPLVMRGQVYYFLISNGVIPTVLGFSGAGGLGIPVHCWLSMNSLRSEE